ncbi:phosphodiester glycosidase family protein [Streptomyces sp. NPDC004393]
MTVHTGAPLSEQDREAIATLRAYGYRIHDIQTLAHDQRAFAVRIPAVHHTIAPGIHLHSAALELGDNCFTNSYTLCVDLDLARLDVVSAARGFHLRDHVGTTSSHAAVSGSFSFISDDPAYQPAEPCLDFCCRDGEVVSLPTATKPALLVRDGRPTIETPDATGTLTFQGRRYRWIGSKTPGHIPGRQPGLLTVFGAANCEVRYSEHPRTGFIRHVDPVANITPRDPAAIDYVVAWSPAEGHRVIAIHPGGGADLFAGNFVLRAGRPWASHVSLGARVEITQLAGRDARRLDSGISIGPSAADAAAGHTPAYDACLGTSPFHDVRSARTLVGVHGRHLVLRVLDGAPKTETFRGTTPKETAAACEANGFDPASMYHLDGGASSKIAYLIQEATRVVGSMHYLKWPVSPSERFRWQGTDGRVLRSALALRANYHQESQ